MTQHQPPTQVTTIDLLRHGECQGGEIFRGSTDSPLTPKGRAQMLAAARHKQAPQPWQHIVTSPLQRCANVATEIASDLALQAQPITDFSEIHFGDWEGRFTNDVAAESPHHIQRFWTDPVNHTPPNGEALIDFQCRVGAAWQQLLKQHHGKHTLLITHGGVIRIILAQLLQMPLRPLSFLAVPHGCLSQIKVFHHPGYDDWPQLIFHNQ